MKRVLMLITITGILIMSVFGSSVKQNAAHEFSDLFSANVEALGNDESGDMSQGPYSLGVCQALNTMNCRVPNTRN